LKGLIEWVKSRVMLTCFGRQPSSHFTAGHTRKEAQLISVDWTRLSQLLRIRIECPMSPKELYACTGPALHFVNRTWMLCLVFASYPMPLFLSLTTIIG
jgi:hypothetical protein